MKDEYFKKKKGQGKKICTKRGVDTRRLWLLSQPQATTRGGSRCPFPEPQSLDGKKKEGGRGGESLEGRRKSAEPLLLTEKKQTARVNL